MFTNSKTILSAAMVLGVLGLLGGAHPALASDHNGQDKTYGGPVQTWCDINPDCNGWNKGQHRASYEGSAPGSAASPPQKPHPSRKHSHEASNR
jgi:hypothetical protein